MVAKRKWRVHRLAYTLWHGAITADMLVCHNCPGGDNRLCFNPEHLWQGTPGDNSRDRDEKGRLPVGEQHPNAILTVEQVREIRTLVRDKAITRRQIACNFGISKATVDKIASRDLWASVV